MVLSFQSTRKRHSLCTISTLVPVLFLLTIIVPLFIVMPKHFENSGSHIVYDSVGGYFLQDDPKTDPQNFDYTKVNLGLIDRTYDTDGDFDAISDGTQWQRFAYHVQQLNDRSLDNVQYKVLIMGRHGEGDHNVAEAFYGTEAWDCYWAALEGNGTVVWADAHLTEKGIKQAKTANAFWREAIASRGLPTPQSYYTSPLARCCETARVTFEDLPLDPPFKPVVKELLREALGIHTCDRRSGKSWIHEHYPDYNFEDGFAEEDELWEADHRESNSAGIARLKKLLDDIFSHDRSTWISLTSHSGAISFILKALGHRDFRLSTGTVIPVLVKAETRSGPALKSSVSPPTGQPACAVNPTPTSDDGRKETAVLWTTHLR